MEKSSGAASGFMNREYRDAGGTIVPTASEAWSADLVTKVKEPLSTEFRFLSKTSTLFTFLYVSTGGFRHMEMLNR